MESIKNDSIGVMILKALGGMLLIPILIILLPIAYLYSVVFER